MRNTTSTTAVLFLAALLLAGCNPNLNALLSPSRWPSQFDLYTLKNITAVGYPGHRPDGNRLVSGSGTLPASLPLDIPLSGTPQWIVAAPIQGGSAWAVALSDGRAEAFRVTGRDAAPAAVVPDRLPPGTPPLLIVDEKGDLKLANALDASASPLTHPVVLDRAEGRFAYVDNSGNLAIRDRFSVTRVPVNALPDARVLSDGTGRVLLLTHPTGRYGHGVLGDAVEAGGIALVETTGAPRVILKIPIPEPSVVEGIAPIWADLTGDGLREIVVTLSNRSRGAWIAAFDGSGRQIAESAPIGTGFRWRHQLAIAPFGTAGTPELVDVRTPHIGGTVEFFHLAGDVLNIVARQSGYTSHVIGSRNLDMAVAGDFDGDGRPELLLPNQSRTQLGAIRRTGPNAEVAWTLPAGGQIRTNLAAVTLSDGRIAVGVGHDGRTLRLWLP